ncbi:hypothetical protein FOYG_13126 [Fusarium oxysporum NRRL 32931]|uniref:Fungal N-terminal domain-containing protein n=1 Tax=Fusarium oxysporum NRRL 32931 TaxID=660029 RepID=W9HL08_FUSOX|nr:hypothetical protein FOYG_13126 [Fusarium oxysporum NRRL 32931]
MADPLSIASGVAGLVSLGLTLCGGLHNYFSNVKGRHQDIETASRSLTLLQSNIFIIQSSTLKLGHRHALSANGVNQGLANCEFELVALQQLMLNLTRDEGLSDITGKLRKQIMIVRYPFDQKKLIQLQDQLSKANATLSSFVQNFNLDINIGISEDLQILKNYTNANDSITHNMLGTIARRLDTIGPAVQRNEMEVATASLHIQENCLSTSSHVSDIAVQPRYCTCSDPPLSSIHRKSSYVNRSWGDWVISREEHKRQCHRPGCMFFSQSLQTSKTTLSYLGFRYWLSQSLSLLLTRDYPAGAYSLSFGIQACNVVKSSPAFQAIIELGWKYEAMRTYWAPYINSGRRPLCLREEVSILLQRLRTIYTSGAASPFDVDENGKNIAHICMNLHREQLIGRILEEGISFEDVFELTRSLLLYMFDLGVPITASSFYQETIISDFWTIGYLKRLPRWYHFITTLDTSFCIEDIAHSKPRYWAPPLDPEALQVWAEYPEIAEAFGFSNIFRAVMQRDRQKLEAITMGDQPPPGILETDVYGRNILHASITWPEGLDLLLQQSQAVSLLCDSDSIPVSPLQIAIQLSGRICTQAEKWVLCEDCHCAVTAQQLLDADCCLPGHLMSPKFMQQCSLRCRKLLFKHLEDRRRRLRDLSLAILPSKVIERYGVTVDSVPDATAAFLWEELQSRSDEWRKQGFRISGGLKPFYRKYHSGGLFEHWLPPKVCSLAGEFRIRLSDEGGFRPLLARVAALHGGELELSATYLNWLMKHDLKLEYVTDGFQTSVLHEFGGRIGRILAFVFPHQNANSPYSWSGEGISLITKICNSELQSNLPCSCISGAFNRPLTFLFSGFTVNALSRLPGKLHVISSIRNLVALIKKEIANVDTSYLARCAVHTMTMEALGIRHVGPCPEDGSRTERRELADKDELAEILDEDRLLLERLRDLDEEFEREFQSRNESVVDFLGGYYSERMLEVLREVDVSPTDDYRRELLAAGLILTE